MTQHISAGGHHASYFASEESHAIVFFPGSLPLEVTAALLERVGEIEHIPNPSAINILRELPGCLYLQLPPL